MLPRASTIRCDDRRSAPRDNEVGRIIAQLSPDEIVIWHRAFHEWPRVNRSLIREAKAIAHAETNPVHDFAEVSRERIRPKFVLTGERGKAAA